LIILNIDLTTYKTIIELADLMVTESLLTLLYGCLAIYLIISIVEILLISIYKE